MATRDIVSAFSSTGLFTAALWLSSPANPDHRGFEHRSLPHLTFASAADVLRQTDSNPDIVQQ